MTEVTVTGGSELQHTDRMTRCVMLCYSNHITARISIQTAGLAFGGTGLCSYCVRGVDGSCAEHSTVESYTLIYAANSHTYFYQFSITHALFHSSLKTFLFCKSFPPQTSFSFSGLTT